MIFTLKYGKAQSLSSSCLNLITSILQIQHGLNFKASDTTTERLKDETKLTDESDNAGDTQMPDNIEHTPNPVVTIKVEIYKNFPVRS